MPLKLTKPPQFYKIQSSSSFSSQKSGEEPQFKKTQCSSETGGQHMFQQMDNMNPHNQVQHINRTFDTRKDFLNFLNQQQNQQVRQEHKRVMNPTSLMNFFSPQREMQSPRIMVVKKRRCPMKRTVQQAPLEDILNIHSRLPSITDSQVMDSKSLIPENIFMEIYGNLEKSKKQKGKKKIPKIKIIKDKKPKRKRSKRKRSKRRRSTKKSKLEDALDLFPKKRGRPTNKSQLEKINKQIEELKAKKAKYM